MDKLLAGYQRFRDESWPRQRERFEALARDGQRPRALVLTCIDSRVDPAMIFDVSPGEILIVRNVASLAPPYSPDAAYHGTSAAIEFGVRVLKVPNVIVLGHGLCGGVKALLEGAPGEALEFVAPWMAMAEAARVRSLEIAEPADRQRLCEQEVVKLSLSNLMTFPWLAERVREMSVRLHGAWFGIQSGVLRMMRSDGTFEPMAGESAGAAARPEL